MRPLKRLKSGQKEPTLPESSNESTSRSVICSKSPAPDAIDTTSMEFTLDTDPQTCQPIQLRSDEYIMPSMSTESDSEWESFLKAFLNDPQNFGPIPEVKVDHQEDALWFSDPQLIEIFGGPEDELGRYDEGTNIVAENVVERPVSPSGLLAEPSKEKDENLDWESNQPAIPELIEDDWEAGLLRLEHSHDFQDTAGLDFGDEHEGQADDDEGDTWSIDD